LADLHSAAPLSTIALGRYGVCGLRVSDGTSVCQSLCPSNRVCAYAGAPSNQSFTSLALADAWACALTKPQPNARAGGGGGSVICWSAIQSKKLSFDDFNNSIVMIQQATESMLCVVVTTSDPSSIIANNIYCRGPDEYSMSYLGWPPLVQVSISQRHACGLLFDGSVLCRDRIDRKITSYTGPYQSLATGGNERVLVLTPSRSMTSLPGRDDPDEGEIGDGTLVSLVQQIGSDTQRCGITHEGFVYCLKTETYTPPLLMNQNNISSLIMGFNYGCMIVELPSYNLSYLVHGSNNDDGLRRQQRVVCWQADDADRGFLPIRSQPIDDNDRIVKMITTSFITLALYISGQIHYVSDANVTRSSLQPLSLPTLDARDGPFHDVALLESNEYQRITVYALRRDDHRLVVNSSMFDGQSTLIPPPLPLNYNTTTSRYRSITCSSPICAAITMDDHYLLVWNANHSITNLWPNTPIGHVSISDSHICIIHEISNVTECRLLTAGNCYNNNFCVIPNEIRSSFVSLCVGDRTTIGLLNNGSIWIGSDESTVEPLPPSIDAPGFTEILCHPMVHSSNFGCARRGHREDHNSTWICWGTPRIISWIPPVIVASLAPRGYYSNGNQIQSCPDGVFSDYTGSPSSLCSGVCTPGRYSLGNEKGQIHQCRHVTTPGYYSEFHAGYPIPCPAGRFGVSSNLKSKYCTAECPIGFWCGNATILPTPCAAGVWGNAESLTTSNCSGNSRSVDCSSSHSPTCTAHTSVPL
jgi:hypothetical protein